ncbi:hypothetical protein WN943_001377 [Citrus x changshan-huyou]
MANDIVGRPFGFIHKGLVSLAYDKDAFATRFKGKCEYIQSELDEVRLEYASFVSELIVKAEEGDKDDGDTATRET